MNGHDYPDGYRPLNYCRGCGRDFSSVDSFDRHRNGSFEYTFSEGLHMDPPVEDGRRCLDDDELLAVGLRLMTREEMLASRRDRRRARFGVPLWFDPAARERVRDAFAEEE